MSKLKIATFNLDEDNGKFPERIHNLSNIIYKNRFDILCLQGDFNSNKFSTGKFLNLELDYNYISIKTKEKKRKDISSSINLTILSKYKIKLLEEIYFNKENDSDESALFISINFEGKDILLINLFLNHISFRHRLLQIKTILEKIKKYNYETTIICGDLNALPSYSEIKLIEKKGFFSKNQEFTHEDKVILDYIFTKSSKKLNIESKVLLKGFSNHNCLLNIIDFS